MIYDRIIVRYGELSLKKKNRRHFTEQLRRNLRRVLTAYPDVEIQATRDRMYIVLNGEKGEEIIQIVAEVFGIQSLSLAIKVEKDIEEMKEAALMLFKRVYKEGNTFKISTKRADKTFLYDTMELNRMFGGHILENVENTTVDVHNPHINMLLDVRREAVYLSCETIYGAGGLPVGSSGKGMIMLSGGIDSPVAGYLAMKRGLQLEAVHFFSPPYTSERAKQKVVDLTEKLVKVGGSIKIHVVPFTAIQQLIRDKIPESYSMTTTRRMMLRITDEIREANKGLAIITGESLGQVASQTLESMYTINEVTTTPILRPLVTMDKLEIIQLAKEIDTYELSIQPYEDCCTVFLPERPQTNPRRDKANHFESYLDFSPLIEEAIQQTEIIVVDGKKETTSEEFADLL